jgi:ferredoxin--NADP+ reductase
MGTSNREYSVAVVGAGPAGIFAAGKLSARGVHVALFNRDIKPGGLAEYGIYYDKYKMKVGLRKQFQQILENPKIDYIGNITVGLQGDLSLSDLWKLGFQAVLVTAGAQGTKWLGLPGEGLKGVYHAKDIVYHFNKLPPFSVKEYSVRGNVALIGAGNVMIDIAHWAIRDKKVNEIVVVVRRGPAEVKFTKKEMEYIIANLDLEAFDIEMERVRPFMEAVGQDLETAKANILAAMPKAEPLISDTRFRFDFLASPTRLIGDSEESVKQLEVEETFLELKDGDVKARGTGTKRMLEVDSVIFCIGDRVDENFGLPVKWNEFVKNPNPRFPVSGISYEAFDPDTQEPIKGVFVAGWSREASNGLVGTARKDGESGAEAVLQYLETINTHDAPEQVALRIEQALSGCEKRIIRKQDVLKLVAAEVDRAQQEGLQEYKCLTNEEMIALIDRK